MKNKDILKKPYYRDFKEISIAPELPDNEQGLRDFFKKHLDCPLPIRDGEKYNYLREYFIWLWKDIAREYSKDVEAKHIYWDDDECDFQLDEDRDYELRPLANNLITWIEDAREDFLYACSPVLTTIADSKTYEKHFLRMPLTIDQISKLAIKKDVSFLLPEISVSNIEDILNKAVAEVFQEIIRLKEVRISIKLDKNIGLTNKGELTNYMMIDISSNSGISHAYPCSEYEANNNIPILVRDKEDHLDYDSFFDEKFSDTIIKFPLSITIN